MLLQSPLCISCLLSTQPRIQAAPSARELPDPPDSEYIPSNTKPKMSLTAQALSPESLFPALLYAANDLQQNHFPLTHLRVLHDHPSAGRGAVTQESPSPHGPRGLAEDRTRPGEPASSLTLPYRQLTLQLFIHVVFKALSL